ncbi:unnamed protein product [Lampetra planeri]
MAQRTLRDSGQDGRSVLGMLAVQVERDAKTGAAVVRSVGPVSTPGAPVASTVFDDGRRSIHTVGGSGDEPSDEEIGQILSAIDSVGKKLLLDEIRVTETKMTDSEVDRESERKLQDVSSEEKRTSFDGLSGGSKAFENGGNMMVVRDMAGREVNMEDQNLEDAPVTLLFLGYTDPDPSSGTCLRDKDSEDMLTVERVFITDEGEEQVLGPEAASDCAVDEEARDEDALQVNDLQLPSSASDGTKDGVKDGTKDGSQYHRRCECCPVM